MVGDVDGVADEVDEVEVEDWVECEWLEPKTSCGFGQLFFDWSNRATGFSELPPTMATILLPSCASDQSFRVCLGAYLSLYEGYESTVMSRRW